MARIIEEKKGTHRHLHYAQQAVESVELRSTDGDANDGQRRLASQHTGEVSSATGGGDDDLDAARGGLLAELHHEVRRAVGRGDAHLKGDVKLGQYVEAGFECWHVRVGAHSDGDEGR